MGPQFVDLDADGHLDFLTATFDGLPYLARGSAGGFLPPAMVVDGRGRPVIAGLYWDPGRNRAISMSRALPEGVGKEHRAVAVLALDWDLDGDLDLLLGTKERGYLLLQRNEGTREAAAFSGRNDFVLAGGERVADGRGITAIRALDWDGDGDQDLICGHFGEKKGQVGGVSILVNEGAPGSPSFAKPRVLVAGSREGGPLDSFYPEVADWDGDGDLDLLVGAYGQRIVARESLAAEDAVTLGQLEEQVRAIDAAMQQARPGLIDATGADLSALSKRILTWENKKRRAEERIQELIGAKRRPGVWLYERK